MAQRLPVQRINVGPQALRHAQRRLKQPVYNTTLPRTSSLTDTFDQPVVYLATGAGRGHQAGPNFSWVDAIPRDTNCAVVWLSTMPGSNVASTVTIGGIPATAVSGSPFVYDATSGYNGIECHVLMNPPVGNQTVAVAFPGTNYVNATAIYYGGVGSVGSPTSTTGIAGTQPSLSVASSSWNALYSQAFSFRAAAGGNTMSAYSQMQRAAWPRNSFDQPIIVGDGYGNGGSLSFSATRNETSYPWGGVALPLNPIAKWSNWGGAVTLANGQLALVPNSSYSSGVSSKNPYDLTGSSVSVQMVQPPNVGTGSIETGLHVSCTNSGYRHSFLLANGDRSHYPDSFNRADGDLGADWSAQSSPAPVIFSNQMVAPTAGSWAGANFNYWTNTTDHQASLVVGNMVAGDSKIELMIRQGAGSVQMSWQDGQAPVFAQNPGFTNRATGLPTSFSTGDTIVFSAVGSVYTLTKNGGTVLRWDDTDGLYSYTGASNGVGVGLQTNGANNCGIDNFLFEDVGRTLSFQTTVGGVVSTVSSVNYDSINHDFLRIREAGGTVYYETSEDGASWDIQTSTPSVFSLSSVYVQIYAGYWGTETSPGTVLFDNLNIAASNPVYRPIKPVSRKTGPMSLRQVIRQRPRAGPRPSVSPQQKIATFTESFDVLDPTVWTIMSGSPSFDGGDLVLPCASTYSTIMSVQGFDLNESSVFIDLQQTQAAGNGTTDTIFAVMSCCSHLAQFVVANGQLITSDTASGYTSTRAYNAVSHRFLRIRATGNGTLYWESSPDASTWTQVATKAASSFAAGNVMVYLSCGYDGVETNPRSAIFDGLNLRPDWPNSRTTVKPVGRKVGPMALRQSRNLRRQQPYPRDVEGIYLFDTPLDCTVSLTADANITTSADASLVANASPVEETGFSALLDVDHAITVPGMEQATVAFDAAATGANSGATTVTSLTWNHTAAAGADVFVFVMRGGSNITVTHDGVAMTYVTAISLNNDPGNGTLYVFRRPAVAAGTKSISVTFASATYASATSVSYLNVGSIKLSSAYAGAALTASQTISGADKSIIVNAISQYCGGVDTFVSSSGGTQRYQGMGSAKYCNLVVQDSTSTGSVDFSSTVTATNTVSGSVGMVLSAAPATTAKAKTVQLLSTVPYESSGVVGSLTWTHDIEPETTILVVAAGWLSQAWYVSMTVNGQAMTRVGGTAYANSGWVGVVEFWYYINPPTGTQTIIYSGGGSGAYLSCLSCTFSNSKAIGTVVQSANAALNVSGGGANDFILNVLHGWVNGQAAFTGYNQNLLNNRLTTTSEPSMFGYARGSSATFSVANLLTNYGGYGLGALPIKPMTDHVADANLTCTVTMTPARPSVNGPYVDSIGAGGIGSSLSFTHTVGSRANLLLVAINNATYNSGPPAVYCDGVAMTQWYGWNYGYVALYNYSHLTWYYLWNPTPGTRTITSGGAGTVSGTSIAIANAGGIGSVTNSGAASFSVTGLPDQLMLNMFGGWPTGGGQNYTGYSVSAGLLWDSVVATGNEGLPTVIGDWIEPSGATTFGATNHSGYATGGQILPIGVARKADPALAVTATLTATAAVNAVAWDSTGGGASAAGAATLTWSHTLGANANCVIVGVTTNTYAYNMPTVKIGSTYLKCLGISYYDPPGNRFGMLFGMMNPPTGTQTFTVTGQVNYTSANSVAYKGVSSISTPAYNNGTGTALSLSMAGVDAGLIVQVLSSNAPSPITTYNQTSRYNIRDSNTYALVIGDGPGGVGAPFTATNPDASAWGTVGVSLQPLSAAVPTGTQFDGMGLGSAMTGYASISFPHVATAGSCVFLDIAVDRNETITNVQYGGQNMTLLGSIRFSAYSGNGGIWRYVINNAPGGLSTVTATLSANAWFEATTMGFTNVGYIGAVQTTSGTSSVPSQSITVSDTGQVVLESLAAYPTAFGTLTGGTNLYKFTGQNSFSLAVNTATATTTFSTGVSETGWGAISNLLSPANTSLEATATFTAEADIYHGTWIVDSDTVAATATLTAEATRNQFATSSLASTATITDSGNFAPASGEIAQVITATLTSTSGRNANVDSSLASTASLTSGDRTNQVFTGSQILTATIDSTATRNAIVNTSMPITGTLASTATKNFNINASLAVTATPTSAVTLAASGNASSTSTATLTGTGTRGAVADVSHTATATFTPVFSRNQKLDTSQTITATGTAIESEAATGATPLSLSAALTATATRNQFCDSATQSITASISAEAIRSVFADGSLTAWAAEALPYTFPFFLAMPYGTATAVKGILGSLSVTADLTSSGTREAEEDASLTVTTGRTAGMTWISRANVTTLAVTATPTASVTKTQFIGGNLGATAEFTVVTSNSHPAYSSLSATASVSSEFNADFLIDALRPVTASLTGIGSRRQLLDAPLAITATLTDVMKWAAKFQASLGISAIPVVIGLRDAKVNGPLVITVSSSQYMFQTEQFDIVTDVVAQPTATMNVNLFADSSTDITITIPVEGLRISFAESTLDVSAESLIEATRDQYVDSRLEVQNFSEGAINWDGLFESVLDILADNPSLMNQGFLVEVNLDLDADTTAEMWLEALLDALLTAETMTLDAYGIRDQYAEALQEISLTVTNETQWDIKMHAILIVPASVFADGRSGQVSSNFFVFYI